MYFNTQKLLVLAALAAVAHGQCKDDEQCIDNQKGCTGKENECCVGFDCFGYSFFKRCQPPPTCLEEYWDCSHKPGEAAMECCEGFVCTPSSTGLKECHKPKPGTRNIDLPPLFVKKSTPPPKPRINTNTTKTNAPFKFNKACLSGDPHITTFDGLRWDCQSVGEHIIFKSTNSRREVQGRFIRTLNLDASMMQAIVIQDEGDERIPKVQLSMPMEKNEGGISTVVGTNGCELQLFVDEKMEDLAKGFENDHVSVKLNDRSIYIKYKESMFSITVRMGYWNGCLLNACFDIPDTDTIVGILGSPDKNPLNDWMTRTGEPLTLPANTVERLKKNAYDYCAQNWCLWGPDDEEKSLFTYNQAGYDYGFFSQCKLDYGTSLIEFIEDVDQDIVDFCKVDLFCLIDALDVGIDAARQARFAPFELQDTGCKNEEAVCDTDYDCCNDLTCENTGAEKFCSATPLAQQECMDRPLSACSDSRPCCVGMQCIPTGVGSFCHVEMDGQCTPEDERVKDAPCCPGLKPFGEGDRKVCKKLGKFSEENQVCNAEQKCAVGLFCRAGHCKRVPVVREWGQNCREHDIDGLNLGCVGDLKCIPWKQRTVCANVRECGNKYLSCAVIDCCEGLTCEDDTDKHSGAVIQQCRPIGQTEARLAYLAKHEKGKKKSEKDDL